MITGRMWIAACFITLMLLPAADRLARIVDVGGPHMVRVVDVSLLMLGGLSFLALLRTYGLPTLLRQSVHLGLVVAAVVLLTGVTAVTCTECGSQSFARPTTLLRGLALLVATHLLLVTYTAEQRSRGAVALAAVATAWALASTFVLRNWPGADFLLYGQTPYLHQPFTSPVQAANFAGVILLLGSGAALALRRPGLLYVFVPAMVIAVAQAGSRSGMALVVVSWAAFVALVVGRHWLVEGYRFPPAAGHLVASALLAAAAVSGLNNAQMSRSLAFVGFSPQGVVSGAADEYRARMWKTVLDRWRGGAVVPERAGTAIDASRTAPVSQPSTGGVGSATTAVAMPTPVATAPAGSASGTSATRATAPDSAPTVAAIPPAGAAPSPGNSAAAPRDAPHNVYLEFLLFGGVASLAGLIGVILLLLALTLRFAWHARRTQDFPFASALALAVFLVAAINYGNVTLHLTFVWVLFGLVTACASPSFPMPFAVHGVSSRHQPAVR